MKTIKIYRNTGYETEICNVSAKQSIHKSAIKGLDEIQISVVIENPLDVQEGDYIKLNGINYTLNRDAEYTIESDVKYNYNLVFEHPFYILLNKLYCNRITGFTNFTLTGKLIDFVQLLTWCVNISSDNPDGVDTGWTIGDVVNTDYKNLSFSDLDCVAVLNKLDEEFGVEHFFNNKQINFVERIERLTDHVFEQGVGKGLYKITQQPVDKEDTVTRLIVRGGNKNTPSAYADEEGYLKLPENYLEDFSEHTKVVEKKKKFEEEFPHFEGSVATVSGDNNEVLTCPQIDFDLSAIAVGENARVNFLTGDLLGNSFEFGWDNSKKQITLIEKTDDTALPDADGNRPTIPSATKKVKVGDTFNFTGVLMPESYVVASIERLREKGNKYLGLFSKKRVKFTLDIDYRYMRGKPDLIVGDLVVISIPQRNFYQVIRVTQLEKNLNSGALSATVSNYLEENWEKYVESRVNNVRNEILASQANVKNTLETIFKDGIVTESELAIIQSVLDRLHIERGQMNAQYLVVRGNINLVNKTPLTNAWDDYQDAYTNISNAINTAIADRKITQAEAQDIEDKLASYSTELNNLTKAIEDARQAIEDKKVEAARLYVEYSATGTGGWHETFNPASDLYMRQKNGANGEWSPPARIVGEAGHAGKDGKYTEYQFAKNTSATTAPTTGWQDAPPAVNADEYIWMRTREVVPPAAPGAWSHAARISGLKGDPGKDGVPGKDGLGIKSTAISYALSASGTTAPTAGWTSGVPALVKGQHLWTRTIWTYTDNTTETGYSTAYIAKDGNKGDDGIAGKDGVGIKNTVITYAASSSGTTPPTSGWSTNPPAASAGQYVWTKTVWTYTDNTTETGFSVGKIGNTGPKGDKGEKGNDGKGVSSTSVTYQIGTSGTSAPTGTWSTSIPSPVKGRYLWARTVTVYTDNSSVTTYSVSYYPTDGQNGADGKGITNTQIHYKLSTSGSTVPTGSWSTSIPSPVKGQYLWTRTVVTYSDNSTSTSYSTSYYATDGQKGDKGDRGEDVGSGKMLYKDPTFKTGVNNTSLYNNASDKSSTTWSRIAKPADAPTDSTHIMRYSYSGNPHPTPGFGGFYQHVSSRANAVFIQKIIAKIPVGRSINGASNPVGTGGSHNNWLTPRDGTGRYETYLRKIICGTSGSFSSSGHVFFEGGANEAFNVDVCYATIIDMTAYDDTADKALAQANKSAAVTDKFATTIDGGLIGTVMILLRELNSLQETAGLSGIQGELKNNPAFWSGGTYAQALALIQFLSKMSAGSTPSSGEYENLAKIVLLHDGAAKVGDFIIEETGRIVMANPSTGQPRLVFSIQNIPDINDLVNSTTGSGTADNSARTLSGNSEFTLANKITVSKDSSTITFKAGYLSITVMPSSQATYAWGSISATLLRDGKPYAMLGEVGAEAIGGSNNASRAIDRTITGCPAGTYSVLLSLSQQSDSGEDIPFANGGISNSTLSWSFTQTGIRRLEFGLNGLMAYYSDRHLYFSESRGLDVKGATNMPGVLVSGRVSSTGVLQYVWKISKLSSITVDRTGAGTYRITHNIGHTRYNPVVVTTGEVRVVNIDSVNANTTVISTWHITDGKLNAPFSFTLIGDNY